MARLTPITSKDQVAAKDHAIVDAIVGSRGALQGPFTMFLHCPEIAGRVAHLGAFVRFEGSLDMRVRVLAAMTAAREFEAVYVWGAQTGGARRLGVPESTITAIREKHTRGMPPEDAQIVEFTQQLLQKHRVDDATFKALQARFGNEGLIELTGAIGYYSMLAMTVNACELEAGPGAEVLKAWCCAPQLPPPNWRGSFCILRVLKEDTSHVATIEYRLFGRGTAGLLRAA